jgi:hypothetical protein
MSTTAAITSRSVGLRTQLATNSPSMPRMRISSSFVSPPDTNRMSVADVLK